MKRNVVKLRGRYFELQSGAFNTFALNLNPLNLDARCLALTDNFQEFRFTKVSYKATSQGALQTVHIGFTPSIPTATPNTAQEIADMPYYKLGNGQFGSPLPKLTLGRKILMGDFPTQWFRRGTGYDDLVEVQGVFSVFLSGSGQFAANPTGFLLEWEMEVCASSDSSNTIRKPPRLVVEESKDDDGVVVRSVEPPDLAKYVADIMRRDGMIVRRQEGK